MLRELYKEVKKIQEEFNESFIFSEERKEVSKVTIEIKYLTEALMSVMQKVVQNVTEIIS